MEPSNRISTISPRITRSRSRKSEPQGDDKPPPSKSTRKSVSKIFVEEKPKKSTVKRSAPKQNPAPVKKQSKIDSEKPPNTKLRSTRYSATATKAKESEKKEEAINGAPKIPKKNTRKSIEASRSALAEIANNATQNFKTNTKIHQVNSSEGSASINLIESENSSSQTSTIYSKHSFTTDHNIFELMDHYAGPNVELRELLNTSEPSTPKLLQANCSYDDIKEFLQNSSINHLLPSLDDHKQDIVELLRSFSWIIYELETVDLDELIDLHHLAIIMMSYTSLETHCQNYQQELFDAVAELSSDLPEQLSCYVGHSLCGRFVGGLDGAQQLLMGLEHHLHRRDSNYDMAVSGLLCIFAHISEKDMPTEYIDMLSTLIDMIERIDWEQLLLENRQQEMFVLIKIFSMIGNVEQSRNPSSESKLKFTHHSYQFKMLMIRRLSKSTIYNNFTMMMERYMAFNIAANGK